MLAKKERDYKQIAARQEMRLRQRFVGRGWLGPLLTQVVNNPSWRRPYCNRPSLALDAYT
jgi:hypothetical protein